MARRKATKRVKAAKTEKTPPTPVQEALQITWVLNGHIKRAQEAYILVGTELADVRDRKLYEALHHPTLEDYAQQRLHLGRSSLYSYLQVHDWIAANHKEWLEPRPKGYIPDLTHAAELMAIEQDLADPKLEAKPRADLEALRAQGLDGTLKAGAYNRWKRRGQTPAAESLKSFLSKLRTLRRRGAQLVSLPPEVIADLDAAIAVLANHQTVLTAGLSWPQDGVSKLWRGNLVA